MVALIASVVLAACGGDDEASEDPAASAEVPRRVAKGFIQQVAAGDSAACELMTPDAVRQAMITGRAPTCEEAIEEQRSYLRSSFDGASPKDLTAELAEGVLVLDPEADPKFRFCLPSETRVTVTLVEGASGWQVDGTGTGSIVDIGPGGKQVPHECREFAP